MISNSPTQQLTSFDINPALLYDRLQKGDSQMNLRLLVVPVLLLVAPVIAGGVDVEILKDAIRVSPVDAKGIVTISAAAGTVIGMFPIQIIAKNKKTDMTIGGSIEPDGSFRLQIPARPKDSIKLTCIGSDGEKESVKIKVPELVLSSPPPVVESEVERTTITIPVGETIERSPAQTLPSRTQKMAPSTDEEIIRLEKNLGE